MERFSGTLRVYSYIVVAVQRMLAIIKRPVPDVFRTLVKLYDSTRLCRRRYEMKTHTHTYYTRLKTQWVWCLQRVLQREYNSVAFIIRCGKRIISCDRLSAVGGFPNEI